MYSERLLDLWTYSGASYTYNMCSHAAVEYYHSSVGGLAPARDLYEYLMSLADPRVADWPLMSSPIPTLMITAVYFVIVLKGPALMEKSKPWKLRPFILAYNAAVTGLNLYIAVELFMTSRQLSFSWQCEPVDYSNKPQALRVAAALWWYYASKLLEMLDSVFFVLRKKPGQLTFLHIYHHSTMFCLWWIGVKYVAGGSSFLGAMCNCFVHVLMYLYYFLAATGPSIRKYLWWKKYLTMLQMAQFVFALVMGINAIRVGCDFPLWMQYSANAYMLSFLVLFSRYFYQEYYNSDKKKLKFT